MSFDLGVPKTPIFFPKEEQIHELWAVFWSVALILLFFFRIEDEELYLEFDPDFDWDAYQDSLDSFTTDNRTPITRAFEDGDLEKVATLLKNGEHDDGFYRHVQYPEYCGISMLENTMIWACRNGDVEVVNILLNNGAIHVLDDAAIYHYDPHDPLFYACKHGHADVAKVLLAKGAKIKYGMYDEDSTTPLLLACQYGHADVVNVLLDYGDDVNQNISMICMCDICKGIKFCRCHTPLYTAWMSAHSSVIKLLKKRGANQDVLW